MYSHLRYIILLQLLFFYHLFHLFGNYLYTTSKRIYAALRVLLPFTTSYLCETGFSAAAVIENKYRSKINVEKEMRVGISKLELRFEKPCSEKQAHPSH
ncbi:unnamed protein product [Parnassius mnemosyne]